MENNYKINRITNGQELEDLCKSIEGKYGKVIMFRLYNRDNFYEEYTSIEEMIEKNNDLSNIVKLTSSIGTTDKVISIEADFNNCLLNVKEINFSKTPVVQLQNDKELSQEELNELMSEENCDYYKFDNGIYVKYSWDTGLYYRSDSENNWVKDNWIISWFNDSEHNYEVIKKNESGARR